MKPFALLVLLFTLLFLGATAAMTQCDILRILSNGACNKSTDVELCGDWLCAACINVTVVQLGLNGYRLATISSLLNSLPGLATLDLSQSQLTGTIPNLDSLVQLTVLRLNNNSLVGAVPDFNLPMLATCDLSHNNLTGSVPRFARLRNLESLWIMDNDLNGSLPSFDLPKCATLHLDRNFIDGTFPEVILPALLELGLISNKISGKVPLFLNSSSLVSLQLGMNRLTGTMPSLGHLKKLENVIVSFNQLTGKLPAFDDLPAIKDIFLNNNFFTGTLPEYNQVNLTLLMLGFNQLNGTLPNFSECASLEGFDAEGNLLTGTIPNFSAPKLWILNLKNNKLEGSVPDFYLPSLRDIVLDSNALTGSVPPFSHVTGSFLSFSLAFNRLSGTIPSFRAAIGLKNMRLNNNNLTGSIPSFSHMANLSFMDLSSNMLTGNVTLEVGDKIEEINLEDNKLDGVFAVSGRNELSAIDISNNGFSSVLISDCDEFRFLRAKRNAITFIELKNVPLVSVDLKYNRLSYYPPFLFETRENPSSLVFAYLTNNSISAPFPADQYLPFSLSVIDLSYNNISEAPMFKFRNFQFPYIECATYEGNFVNSFQRTIVLDGNRIEHALSYLYDMTCEGYYTPGARTNNVILTEPQRRDLCYQCERCIDGWMPIFGHTCGCNRSRYLLAVGGSECAPCYTDEFPGVPAPDSSFINAAWSSALQSLNLSNILRDMCGGSDCRDGNRLRESQLMHACDKNWTQCTFPCVELPNLTSAATPGDILRWISEQLQTEHFLVSVLKAKFDLSAAEARAINFSNRVESFPDRQVANAFESAEYVEITVPRPCYEIEHDRSRTLLTLLCNFDIFSSQRDCARVDLTQGHFLLVSID